MNSDINTPSFHRTGKTWAWLLVATLLWLVTCLWALDYAGYSLASFSSESGKTSIVDNQREAVRVEAEEARELAAAEEAASAAALTEAARVAALLVEQSNENSQADEDGDDAARQGVERQNIDAQAQQSAANEAARVAAVARKLREFEELKTQELRVLRGLSPRTQFLTQNSSITRQLERTLDRMFDPLYLYSELPVVVAVASNDGDQAVANDDLSNDRARAIVDYLVSRGLERGRFSMQVESVGGMPVGTHRVRVFVLEDDQ